MAIYVPIIMYEELHCLLNCLYDCTMRVRGCYHFIALLLVSEIAKCIDNNYIYLLQHLLLLSRCK